MKFLLWVAGVVVVTIIGAVIFIYSGIYNISATIPHNGLTHWIMSTTMDNSVKHHAKNIVVPDLSDSSKIEMGFVRYRAVCANCHGAPGVSQEELAAGLYPKPPKLVRTIHEWTPAELFWITKYGVKMTGMPAWGPTHSDDKIWSIVAFMEKMQKMTPEQYKIFSEEFKNEKD
ncbi:MAG TPA: cytochrome c [Ignavibacteriaceae bacterium]|nr:cytochrome c [Ignavibacteriaceae bacterium]